MQKVVLGNKRCFISGAHTIGSQPKMDVGSEDGQEKQQDLLCYGHSGPWADGQGVTKTHKCLHVPSKQG